MGGHGAVQPVGEGQSAKRAFAQVCSSGVTKEYLYRRERTTTVSYNLSTRGRRKSVNSQHVDASMSGVYSGRCGSERHGKRPSGAPDYEPAEFPYGPADLLRSSADSGAADEEPQRGALG